MVRLALAVIPLTANLAICACSSASSDGPANAQVAAGGGAASPRTAEPSTTDSHLTNAGGTSAISIPIASEGSVVSSTCVAHTANAERRPVYLAFAFDVSGSMGKLDLPWHDPTLKWEPVVTATEDFFAAPNSAGIWASLTFFPGDEDKCDPETYGTPDVPMTSLPSSSFTDAITDIAPQGADDWRGGTPTLAVLKGVFDQLERVAESEPNAEAAVVLVTDGYPQGCDDSDIERVQEEVKAHSTVATYVIGVENPPIDDAPDTVSNLHSIAEAGHTDAAFLIQTGDPRATSKQFAAVIEQIRGAAISCEYMIPEPPAGEAIDKSQVNVTYRTSTNLSPFVYEPNCDVVGAWHYDDVEHPGAVVLCPKDCATVMADPHAEVVVEFGCEQRTPYLL